MAIRLSKVLSLPNKILNDVWCILGRRGSGKSYSIGLAIEQIVLNGYSCIVVDPLGAHSKIDISGKVAVTTPKPGDNVDVEKAIETASNRTGGCALIFNLEQLPLEEQRMFVSNLCAHAVRTELPPKRPICVIFDEVQEYCGSYASESSAGDLVRFAKMGRKYGWGSIIATQKVSDVSKKLISQANAYLIHRLIELNDVNRIKDQIDVAPVDGRKKGKSVSTIIPTLKAGEFVFWSTDYVPANKNFFVVGKGDNKISGRITQHDGSDVMSDDEPEWTSSSIGGDEDSELDSDDGVIETDGFKPEFDFGGTGEGMSDYGGLLAAEEYEEEDVDGIVLGGVGVLDRKRSIPVDKNIVLNTLMTSIGGSLVTIMYWMYDKKKRKGKK